MNRVEITRLAFEAGFDRLHLLNGGAKRLIDFANLIAAAEREACAQLVEDYLDDPFLSGHGYASGCAAAIRARGEA